ncbi:MAG: pilus assembly PilX N-terminal domain-containing protein [Pedobacter sp.]
MANITRNRERGAALITALVILTLLTLIGLAATNTSMLETMISSSERRHAEAFYVAEAGIEHLRRNFKTLFIEKNQANFAAVQPPDWDFVLNGSQPGIAAATDTTYAGGAQWIIDGDLGSDYLYTVTVWNNNDGGGAIDDTDSVIFMRADARSANGGASSVEISLFGGAAGGQPIGGYEQGDGGTGKNHNSNDANAITDFSLQSN